MEKQYKKYLPLTEATAYTMIALADPLHGYGVMQKVEALSQGTVKLGPGTLYGALKTLQDEKLIDKEAEEGRRKIYSLTDRGRQVLKEHIRRTEILAEIGQVTEDW